MGIFYGNQLTLRSIENKMTLYELDRRGGKGYFCGIETNFLYYEKDSSFDGGGCGNDRERLQETGT